MNIHKIETGIIRRVVNSSGELKNITFSDAKTQTNVSYNLGQENDDEDEGIRTRDVAKIENCPICLERFSEENSIFDIVMEICTGQFY